MTKKGYRKFRKLMFVSKSIFLVKFPGEIEVFLKFAVRKWKCLDPDPTTPRFQTRLTPLAEAKKMKSLTLHTHGCLRASLRDCSSLPRFVLSINNLLT